MDNLEKYLNDACNGVVWKDDSQIAWVLKSKTITAEKNGCTDLFVCTLPNTPLQYEHLIRLIAENIKIPTKSNNENL